MKSRLAVLALVILLLIGCTDKSGVLRHRGVMLEYRTWRCDGMGLVILVDVTAYAMDKPDHKAHLDRYPYPLRCEKMDVYQSYSGRMRSKP